MYELHACERSKKTSSCCATGQGALWANFSLHAKNSLSHESVVEIKDETLAHKLGRGDFSRV